MTDKPESIWPDTLKIRDTGLYTDEGQRIYTTAGMGYERMEYTRVDAGEREGVRRPFQQRVGTWMDAVFGTEIASDIPERNHRFLEEALELVQSKGCTKEEAHQLVDYVFGRPPGHPQQEVGGVMVTLAALCNTAKIDMIKAADAELDRNWVNADKIRAKHASKPQFSPLPGTSEEAEDLTQASEKKYLILKDDVFYRDDVYGYTQSAIMAGRYTKEEAEDLTHPNGPDGPRDGLWYMHERSCGDENLKLYQQAQDRIAHLEEALTRIAEPKAFYLPTSNVDPEAYARMIFAQSVLDGRTVERSEQKAEYDTRERYDARYTGDSA